MSTLGYYPKPDGCVCYLASFGHYRKDLSGCLLNMCEQSAKCFKETFGKHKPLRKKIEVIVKPKRKPLQKRVVVKAKRRSLKRIN